MEQNVTFKDAGDTKGITVVSNYADLRHALCSAQPMTICVDGYIDCGVNPVVLFPGQRIVGKIPGNKKRFPKSKPSGLLMRICGQAPAVLMAENSGLVDLTVKVMVSSSGVGDASKQRIISFDETAREAFWENVDVQFDASRREAKGSLNVIEIPRSLNELKLLGSCFIIDQTREFIGCGIQGHSGKSVLNVCGKLDIEMENGQAVSNLAVKMSDADFRCKALYGLTDCSLFISGSSRVCLSCWKYALQRILPLEMGGSSRIDIWAPTVACGPQLGHSKILLTGDSKIFIAAERLNQVVLEQNKIVQHDNSVLDVNVFGLGAVVLGGETELEVGGNAHFRVHLPEIAADLGIAVISGRQKNMLVTELSWWRILLGKCLLRYRRVINFAPFLLLGQR